MNKTIVSSILSVLIGFSAGYFVFKQPEAHTVSHKPAQERKILYYQDPMNPEVTSHTPKKAADGMDFVPVYEKEKPADGGTEIAYYVDPMHPWYTSEKPGKAPDCGMDLVPVYKNDEKAQGVKIDPSMIQSMGVTLEKAEKRTLSKTIRASGLVEIDESRLYTVTTKFMGWVDRLKVNRTGQAVSENQSLFTLYSPDLVSAQDEYLLALKYRNNLSESGIDEIRNQGDGMIESVVRRLSYWDIGKPEILALEKRGKPVKNIEIRSPYRGVVMDKMITEGDKIEAGMPLYRIADLSTVWVTADVYPQDLPWIGKGGAADMSFPALPDRTFKGNVEFLYPTMNGESRTAKIRIVMKNDKNVSLKPGMIGAVSIASAVSRAEVTVPEQAVIKSGLRDIAVVALGDGYFAPREIRTGVSEGGYIQVLDGIREGEDIVTSSQFLIDSESNLRAAIAGMGKKPTADSPPAQSTKAPPSSLAGGTLVADNAAIKNNAASKPLMASAKTRYTCDMHPEIIKDKPGNCPICGMHLVPVKAEKKDTKKIQYTCEMHPEVIKDKPGSCPVCGMHLVPVKTEKKDTKKIQYTCEMHPEVIKDKPGSCPICGMFLTPKK